MFSIYTAQVAAEKVAEEKATAEKAATEKAAAGNTAAEKVILYRLKIHPSRCVLHCQSVIYTVVILPSIL